jgi:hypothetical protein
VDKKQVREWCAYVFNIKGNGLAMVLFQIWSLAITIIVHEDVPLGLVSINKQHKGKDTETHSGLKADEKLQIFEGLMMVTAH